MTDLLNQLSGLSTLIITVAFGAHLFLFLVLRVWAKRDLRGIVGTLDDFTRGLKHRSILDRTGHLTEQVDAFLADVADVLNHPEQSQQRQALSQRMNVLDERRDYVQSMFFETVYNVARNMIDAYPLMGVLGTILAIGAALQSPDAAAQASGVEVIVGRFGEAIWSTFAGLVAGILLMLVNSFVEPSFLRLSENRTNVRDMVSRAKRELLLSREAAAT